MLWQTANTLSEQQRFHLANYYNGKNPKGTLIGLQQKVLSLSVAWKHLVSEVEAAVTYVCYYTNDGVLMKTRSSLDTLACNEWRVVSHIVVLKE